MTTGRNLVLFAILLFCLIFLFRHYALPLQKRYGLLLVLSIYIFLLFGIAFFFYLLRLGLKFPLSFFLILYASGEQTLPLPWREDSPVPSISSQGSSWIEESYGYQGEASSSVPNPVQPYGDQGNMAEIPNPVQPHAAQDIQQDNLWNELDQPLIDEAERRNQLSTKLANRYSFGERTNRDLLRFERELQTHVEFEIEVERQLRLEGYTPATINRTREQIRDLIFYKTDNSPKSHSTLDRYLREMNGDFHSSAPWKILKNARNNNRLNLYKPGDLFSILYSNHE